jgi:spore coat polysaccharide biosynthesis protein SpsF
MKPIIITQARMNSTRLTGKILRTVKNKALLDYHIDRLLLSSIPICVATTRSPSDDNICQHLSERQIKFYRGSETDVLSRFYECAKYFCSDIIVRVTSDCPLIDGRLIKDAVDKYISLNNHNLYLSNTVVRTFPRGFDFEIFSFNMLESAFKNATEPLDREHVTTYIRRNCNSLYNNSDILYSNDASHFRLTVDEAIDLELITKLIKDYSCDNMSAEQIILFLNNHPELAQMNSSVEQKKSPGST